MTLFTDQTEEQPAPLHIRLPFVPQPTGLGPAISAATAAVGVKPCKPCKERAQKLNQRVVFDPWAT